MLVARAAFAATPSSAAQARRFLGAALQRWRCDAALVERVVLLGSELVGRGLAHGGRPVRVSIRLEAEGDVRLEVADGADEHEAGGRVLTEVGRAVVEAVTDRWGTESTSWGRLVWCEIDGSTRQPSE